MDLYLIMALCIGKKKKKYNFSGSDCQCIINKGNLCDNKKCFNLAKEISFVEVRHCKINIYIVHTVFKSYCSEECKNFFDSDVEL